MSRTSDSGSALPVRGAANRLPKRSKVLDRIRALESIGRRRGARQIGRMIEALSDRSPAVRATAAKQLGNLRDDAAVSVLTAVLTDRSYEVRMAAVKSLSKLLKGNKALPEILRLLTDRDELVRIETAEALARIGDRTALPFLWTALRDKSPLVRSYVAAAIGELGRRRDITALESEIEREVSDTVKVGILGALLMRGRKSAPGKLLALLESRDYRVRCATANTLSEIDASSETQRVVLASLQKALVQEPTVAARSSIRSSIRAIQRSSRKRSR
jgi:HEAT repeat protein